MQRVDERKPSRSWVDEARVRFDAANDGLLLQTRALLGRLIADPARHARFANTLALLEHIGSYKIMVSQHSPHIERATLRHIAEEAQHAHVMRRHAEKTLGRPLGFTATDLLAPAAARMYFQRLEARVLGRLRARHSAVATYLYVSLVIELRALWFYGLYNQALRSAGIGSPLRRILGEEEHHLHEMADRLESAGERSDARADEFVAFERRLYGNLLAAMRRELQARLG